MKKILRSSAAILLALAVLSFAGCAKKAPASSVDGIKKAGKIVLGTSADFPPL